MREAFNEITVGSKAAFRSDYVFIGESRWTVWSRDVHVQSSVVMNVLPAIVVDVTSAEVGIVKSVVLIPRSSSGSERLRWFRKLLVEVLRRWDEFDGVNAGCWWSTKASRKRRNLLVNAALGLQIEFQAAAAFREVQVLDMRELSFRLLAVLQVEWSV